MLGYPRFRTSDVALQWTQTAYQPTRTDALPLPLSIPPLPALPVWVQLRSNTCKKRIPSFTWPALPLSTAAFVPLAQNATDAGLPALRLTKASNHDILIARWGSAEVPHTKPPVLTRGVQMDIAQHASFSTTD